MFDVAAMRGVSIDEYDFLMFRALITQNRVLNKNGFSYPFVIYVRESSFHDMFSRHVECMTFLKHDSKTRKFINHVSIFIS